MGIVLAQNSFQELVVLTMNEGGPAARSNLIKKHDVLQTIDGKDVYKQTIDQIRPLILGVRAAQHTPLMTFLCACHAFRSIMQCTGHH